MKKKFLALLLCTSMVVSMAACGNSGSSNKGTSNNTDGSSASSASSASAEEGSTASSEPEAETVVNLEPSGQLIIGDSSEMSGDVTPYWTNNAADFAVFEMTSQSMPVEYTKDGEFVWNENVVASHTETENEDGSLTYDITIQEGLKWSNGDPITAKDYICTILLFSSDEIAVDLKASGAFTGMRYLGYSDYSSGKTDTFKGARLLSDTQFQITIDPEFVPYYYGKALVGQPPTYMKGWLPEDVDIEDTEDGCKFTDNFTAKYIKDTVETERYTPTAMSGPYYIESYDQSNYAYTLKVNKEFVGNYEGKKANIETIIYRYVEQDTMMDQLKTGAVDLLLQATDGKEINEGLDMVDAGGYDYVAYDRNGYGQLIFKCNVGPTQFTEVRQAIAYLLDRNEFAKTFTGGHGTVVNGPYGSAQWMVQEAQEQIDTLDSYDYSPEKAVEVLEAGGWTKDKDGNDYSGTGLRYKEVDGKLMPLKLKWCSSENNSVSDLLVSMLANNEDLKNAGIEIEQTVVTFPQLLDAYYTDEGDYNMFNMGAGFTNPYKVIEEYEIDGVSNYNRINDEQLAKLAADMDVVEEGDDAKYLETWFAFQKRWNELLPNVPLYSNTYHDFFSSKLKGYERDDLFTMQYAIIYASVDESAAE